MKQPILSAYTCHDLYQDCRLSPLGSTTFETTERYTHKCCRDRPFCRCFCKRSSKSRCEPHQLAYHVAKFIRGCAFNTCTHAPTHVAHRLPAQILGSIPASFHQVSILPCTQASTFIVVQSTLRKCLARLGPHPCHAASYLTGFVTTFDRGHVNLWTRITGRGRIGARLGARLGSRPGCL